MVHSKTSLSYLLTIGLVGFTKYSLLPWLLVYLHSRKYESWVKVVIAYGTLFTFMNIGSVCGKLVSMQCSKISAIFYFFMFVLIAGSYIAISYITRFIFVVFFFWLIGFSGVILTDFSLSLDKSMPSLIAFEKKGNNHSDASSSLDRELIIFIFATLLAGYLYDNRTPVNFPASNLAMVFAVGCLCFSIYFLLLRQSLGKRIKANANHKHNHGHPHHPGTRTRPNPSPNAANTPPPIYTGDVPLNFLSNCRGDLTKARAMYAKTLQWRKDYEIDHIFETPQDFFHEILKFYPHGIHGYSLDGCAVVYEILGKGNPRGLASTLNSIEDLVWHFNLRNEFVFQRLLAPSKLKEVVEKCVPGAITITPFPYHPASKEGVQDVPVPRLMTVIDVEGISISSVTTDVISFIKKSSETIDNYYPEQVARLVVCNAPRWFSTIWTVIARVLPEAVQKKVDILYDCKGLDKYIHPSQRPKEYGGTDVPLGQGEGHLQFVALEKAWADAEAALRAQSEAVKTPKGGSSSSKKNSSSSKKSSKSNKSRRGDNPSDTSLSSQGNQSSNSLIGWFSSKFKSKTTPSAYLGEKNIYKYNESTGKWEMDVGSMDNMDATNHPDEDLLSEDDDSVDETSELLDRFDEDIERGGIRLKKPKMSKEQLEEHGLVLAIHAAHYASTFAKERNGLLPSPSMTNLRALPSTNDLTNSAPEPTFGFQSLASETNANASSNTPISQTSSNYPSPKVSPIVFLIVFGIFFVSRCVELMFFTLLPVWFSGPLATGALGYSARDLGLLFSTIGLILLQIHKLFGDKMAHILKSSPVRALRISSGFLILFLLVLTWYSRCHLEPIEDILHHFEETTEENHHLLIDKDHHAQHSIQIHSEESDQLVLNGLLRLFPTYSITSLFIFASLTSGLLASLYLSKRAASMMLHVILASSFQSSVVIRYVLTAIGDVFGPILSVFLFSVIYSAKLKFPMNSSCFLYVGMIMMLSVYMLSLLVMIQFRGDYGVMSDYQDMQTFAWRRAQQEQLHQEQQQQQQAPMLVSRSNHTVNEGLKSPSGGLIQRSSNLSSNQLRNFSSNSLTSLASSSSVSATSPINHLHHHHNTNNISLSLPSSHQNNNSLNDLAKQFNEHFLSVPLGDINLLFSSIGHGYGSKLHNLKDDYKDV